MGGEHERPTTNLVAGGTGALGAALVALLLDRGEKVCVPYVTESAAERLRDHHRDELTQGRLRVSRCDVADPDQVAALLDVLQADWGPLWLACSTAGGWEGGTTVEEMDDLTLLDRQLLLNLRTATVVAREGLRHMGERGGRVVLVGSRSAMHPSPGEAAYAAAKAGVLALVATLARELRGTGRTANAIVPTIFDTTANRAAMPGADHARWVPPHAAATVIAWLASVEAWAVTGAAIPVPGDT